MHLLFSSEERSSYFSGVTLVNALQHTLALISVPSGSNNVNGSSLFGKKSILLFLSSDKT